MTPHMRKKWDEKIAEAWPDEWARANSGANGSKKRSSLRKRFIAAYNHEQFVKNNPSAKCANCDHCSIYQWSRTGNEFTCDLDSDFHGYALTKLNDVCIHWIKRNGEELRNV
ncbi:MAG: hypothetical protein EP341_03230 [Sphingomonadales bacterium]|nr:MAG: hypothetical protein EP341_03230 [Sphingomonadales bacterium]